MIAKNYAPNPQKSTNSISITKKDCYVYGTFLKESLCVFKIVAPTPWNFTWWCYGILEKIIMNGIILAYSSIVSAGVITGSNGKNYGFILNNWRSRKQLPKANQKVHFNFDLNNAFLVTIV